MNPPQPRALRKFTLGLSLSLLAAATASAANLTTGYTIGGFGPNVFLDNAGTGGGDSTQITTGGDPGFVVQMTNLWKIGDTVRLTGVALPIRPTTTAGTFTFNFYGLDQGADTNGFEGVFVETLLGSAQATLAADVSAANAFSVVFDMPVVFTAASSGVAVQFTNASPTAAQNRYKINTAGVAPNAVRLNTTTGAAIGGANPNMRFTLAGSIVVPPAVGSLVWQGNTSADWDTTTVNWARHLGGYAFTPDTYSDNGTAGPQVIFDDTLAPALRTNIALTTGVPLRPSSLIFANANYRYVLGGAGKITGPTVLTNQGSGVVTLNTANDFTGGSMLSGGRVRLGNAGGLGVGDIRFASGALSSVGTAPVTVANRVVLPGTAVLGNATDSGVITLAGTVDFNGSTATIDAQSDVVISGVLTNGGIASKNGPGTLTITGLDYESNATWAIRKGTLVFNAPSPANPLAGLRVGAAEADGVARCVITNHPVINLTANSSVLVGVQGQSALSTSNFLDLAGSLLMPPGSTNLFIIGQASAYNRADIRPGSVLQLGGILGFGTAINVLNLDSATLVATANNTNFFTGVTTATITGDLTVDAGNYSLVANQSLHGNGRLTKTGAGTLWLSGTNTYTGPTVVTAGTLGLYPGEAPNPVLSASSVVVSNGATLAASFVPLGPGVAEIPGLALNGSTLSVNYGDLLGFPPYAVVFGGPAGAGVPVAIAGVNPIRITGQNFGVGQYPILRFSSFTGSGSFVASLPLGVVGSVATNGNLIVVNITSAPKSLNWYGSTDFVNPNLNWNTTSLNWNFGADKYSETAGLGDFVRFDDAVFFDGANFATSVNLAQPVAPVTMTVDSALNYSFASTGAGRLTGGTALTKQGTGSLKLLTANDYTGGSVLAGGTVQLGHNTALGSGNVTLSGGGLSSDGATARTVANALTIAGSSALGDAANSGALTLNGPVSFGGGARDLNIASPVTFTGSMSNGGLDEKTGPATLTFSGVTGTATTGNWQIEEGNFVISGGNLAKSGGGVRIGSTLSGGTTRLAVTDGAVVTFPGAGLNLRIGNDQAPAAAAGSTNILDVAGTIAWTTTNAGAVFMGQAGQLAQVNLLPGGHLKVGYFIAGANRTELNFNGGTLSPTTSRADFLQGLTAATVLPGGATIDTDGQNVGIAQPLLNGGGGLTKLGAGTLALNGVNTYTGTTLVSGGALGGTGVLSGPVTIGPLGTLAPGNGIGALTINGSLSLGGNALIEINQSAAPAHDSVVVSGALTYGGTITVVNLGPTLALGDSFPVFPAGGTGTATVVGDAGAGLAFSLNPATGVVSVVAAPTSTTLHFTDLGGGVYQFSWTGAFKLQYQTNPASVGLANNWMDYPNPSNPINVTNNLAVPTAFFRLISQ